MPTSFEFEVSLIDIEPRIWRQFRLKATANFQDLHDAIQDAGPWEDYHLFRFETLAKRPKHPEPIAQADCDGEADTQPEWGPPARRAKLRDWFRKEGDRCVYVYDFGDGWRHLVELKAVLDLPETFKRRLVGGARAFPPEDCGGVWGYERCLAAIGAIKADDFDEEELEETREWLGSWDQEAFDLEAARKEFDA